MSEQLDALIKLRRERNQLYARLAAWGKTLQGLGYILETYKGQTINVDSVDYPNLEQIHLAIARYDEMSRQEVELYDQLPEDYRREVKAPDRRS